MNRILPDFKLWAESVVDRGDLTAALEQAYTQGYYAGRLDEETEWWIEQDLALYDQEN